MFGSIPDFHWELDASWIAVVILLVLYFGFICVILEITAEIKALRVGTISVICIVVLVASFTATSFATANFSHEETLSWGGASARDVSAAMGLKSGNEYPLTMGSRVGGSSVEAAAGAGIFSARAYVNAKPASAVSLGFTVGEKSWILEVPVSAVTFIQSGTEKASVRMVLTDAMINRGVSSTEVRTFGPEKCHLHNLFLVCPRDTLSSKTIVKPGNDLVRKGLPPIVNKYLDSAVITLTPAMYKDVLGLP